MVIDAAGLQVITQEQVQQNLVTAYAAQNTFLTDFISSTPLELTVGARAVRQVLELQPSISVAQVNEQGGSLPRGGSVKFGEFYVGTHSLYMAASIEKREEDLGSAAGRSLVDLASITFGRMAANMAKVDNIICHLEDNGILAGLGTGASAVSAGAGTMTFAAATDIARTTRLIVGMAVEIYSQDLATRRVPPNTSVLTVVSGISRETNVVTFDNLPATVAIGDRVLVPGLSNPDTANGFYAGVNTGALVSTSGTNFTPNPASATGAALTFNGSPFRKGLPYFCLGDPAAKYFTLTRGNIEYFKPTRVDAGTAVLTPAHLMTFRTRHEEKTMTEFPKLGMFYAACHSDVLNSVALSQVTANSPVAWLNAAVAIPSAATEVGPIKDPVPSNTGLAGRPVFMGIHFHTSPLWKRGHIGIFCEPQNRIKRAMAPNGQIQLLNWAGRDEFEGRDAQQNLRLIKSRYMSSNYDLASMDPSGNGEIINVT